MRTAERCTGGAARLCLGGVWVFVVGCALRIVPVPIEPHLTALEDGGAARRPALGVGIFQDRRPPSTRVEVHPPLRLHGIGFARRGQVRTGDASFVGELAAGVRRDAIATLARSGLFSAVRPVPVADPEALARPRPDDPELTLTATVEQLGAFQQQNSTLSLLRVGWLRNRFEASVGFARIYYQLYEGSSLLFEYRISVDHVSIDQPITRAALDAMAVANETLVRRLYADLGRPSEDVLTVVPLQVLDACALGRERVMQLLGDADEVFEREVGLRFDVTHRVWRGAAPPAAAEEALKELREHVSAAEGVVLALVPQRRSPAAAFADGPFGLADPFGQHAVVGCVDGADPPVVTLVHELAHLFGAVHVYDRSSVMHDTVEFDGRFFDPLNRRILRATRTRPLGRPLPGEMERRVSAIYAAAARFSDCCPPECLEAVRAALPRP